MAGTWIGDSLEIYGSIPCKIIDFPIPFIDRSSKYIQSD